MTTKQTQVIFAIPAGFIVQYQDYHQALQSVLSDALGYSINIQERSPWSPIAALAEPHANLVLVNIYESLYLETFFEYHSILKFQNTAVYGLIVSHQHSTFSHLTELRGLTISFLIGNDFMPLNPVIYYLLKYTHVVNYQGHFKNIQFIAAEIEKVIEREVSGAVIDSQQYGLLPASVRANLKICGRFPIVNEQIAVINFNPEQTGQGDVSDAIARAIKKYAHQQNQYLIDQVNREEYAFLLEGIEGLGYNLKEFIEQYPNIVVQAISESFIQEYHDLQSKYYHQIDFNEKLVKLYHEVRSNQDRLLSENRKLNEKIVLFDKNRAIIGVSRAFAKFLHSKRQKLIGKDLSSYLEPQMNKSLKELIYQIDCELVKSFNVRAHKENGEEVEAKLECKIIELEDAKNVIGILTPKS